MKRATSVPAAIPSYSTDTALWETQNSTDNIYEFPASIARPAASHSRGIVYFICCLSLDAGFLLVAFVLGFAIRSAYSHWINPLWPVRIGNGFASDAFLGLCVFITLSSLMYEGIYNTGLLSMDRTEKITRGICWSFFMLIAVSFLLHQTESMSRLLLFLCYACFLLLVILCRPALEKRMARRLQIHPVIRLFPSVDLPDSSREALRDMGFQFESASRAKFLTPSDLTSGMTAYGSKECTERLIQMETYYRELGIMLSPGQITPLGAQPVNLRGIQIFVISHPLRRRLNQYLKRGFDLTAAIGLLPVLSMAGLFISLWIWVDSRGPIFYRQPRLGFQGRTFTILKFRTMAVGAEQNLKQLIQDHPELKAEFQATFKLKKDPRITRCGRWLRRTSLDELPQIWNVLRGEMSLVGPRAIVESEQALYGPAHAIIRTVKPGITGIWQTSGRNDLQYSVRLDYDLYYVRNWSLWLDLSLLIKTLQAMVLPGAY